MGEKRKDSEKTTQKEVKRVRFNVLDGKNNGERGTSRNRAAESVRVQAFAKDLGRAVPIRLHIDSSAALSIISRTGLGKAKHVEIQHLWLQEAVHNNKLTVEDIPTETLLTWAQSISQARDRRC